ncbi:cellulose binding domain-containing protein [Planomonospora parontospora]|nr:cellulose binding domain-containing protein [Planomonospora parontospora]
MTEQRVRSGTRRRLAVWSAAAFTALATAVAGFPGQAHADGPSCSLAVEKGVEWRGGFNIPLRVVNTGTVPLNGWRVTWTFTGDQKLHAITSSRWSQTGRQVTAGNAFWNGNLAPGAQTGQLAANGSSSVPFGPLLDLTCTPL